MNSKRYDNILNSVNNRLVKDNKAKNIELITNTIKRESQLLVKEIEKSTGIKLPQTEAECHSERGKIFSLAGSRRKR